MTTLLDVANLSVSYGSVMALRGISLRVAERELVTVVGPNGAGKSTLLGAIVGTRRIVDGAIKLADQDIVGWRPETIARSGISLVPEGRQIFTTLTVGENLLFGTNLARAKGLSPPSIDEIFEMFPILRRYEAQPAATLSGGEQQQLAIARALLSKPRLLLLDEPSLGLAPKLVDLVFDAIERLKSEGLTILLVEQNVGDALALADRAYVLRNGTVELEGPATEVGHARVERTVLGLETKEETNGR